MHTFKTRWLLAAAAVAIAGTILVLWSWNTVVGLFGGPVAEFRHAVAALVLLGIARWVVGPRRVHQRASAPCPARSRDHWVSDSASSSNRL